MPELPKRAAIIGGGVIGCEFASMLSDLGTRGHDPRGAAEDPPGPRQGRHRRHREVVQEARHHDPHRRARSRATRRATAAPRVQVGGEGLDVDVVVVSVGRRPNTDDLGPRRHRREGQRPRASSRSTRAAAPASPACGPSATPSPPPRWRTSRSSRASSPSRTSSARTRAPVDYGKVPWCVYSRPEAAFTGMSEEAAKEAGLEVVTQKSRFNHNGRAMIVNQNEGMVKVIAEKGADGRAGRILGVHMVGPLGHRAARPGLPRRELGGHRRRHGLAHPAPPHDDRGARRGDDLAHRPPPARIAHEEHRPRMADITMPQLGETVTEGTITKWFKQVGDAVAEDEPLFEVSTDKVDSEVPSPVTGTLTEIQVPEGETVDVGVVLAVVGDAGAAPAAAAAGRGARRRGGPPAEEPAAPRPRRPRPPRTRPPPPPPPPPPPLRPLPRLRRRRGRRRRRRTAAVAGRAPAHRRARPRPRRRSRAPASAVGSPATTCSPPPTAKPRGGRPGRRRRPPRRGCGAAAAAAGAGRPEAVRPLGRARHGRAAVEHPQAHGRAHAPLARHLGPRLRRRSRSTTRASTRSAGPRRTGGRRRRASASPTCRSSPGPSSTPSTSSPRSTPPSPTRRWWCTTTSTSASPSTSTSRA